MENRRIVAPSARNEGPVQLTGDDFVPPDSTVGPQTVDDPVPPPPPPAYDCKPPRAEPPHGRGKTPH